MSDEKEQTVTIPVSEYLELLKHKPDGESSLAVRTGSVFWLPGWYATKLHAAATIPDMPLATVQAACGAWVYRKAPTPWAQRNVDKGLGRCKHCERILSPNNLDEPTPAHATSTKQENGHDKH